MAMFGIYLKFLGGYPWNSLLVKTLFEMYIYKDGIALNVMTFRRSLFFVHLNSLETRRYLVGD